MTLIQMTFTRKHDLETDNFYCLANWDVIYLASCFVIRFVVGEVTVGGGI